MTSLAHASFVDQRRRHILIIGIFDALDRSGVRPVHAGTLHTVWYLANVLAPAWGIKPFDAALLKTERQPFYPILQSDVEDLLGMGMLLVASLAVEASYDRLQVEFALNREFVDPVLATMKEIDEEAELLSFLDEVVQASNRLSDAGRRVALANDATYGNPVFDTGSVIDLGEWLYHDQETPTVAVLREIASLSGHRMKPAELMDIYVDHLGRKLQYG